MATLILKLQRDEHGFIVSTELVLIATLCVLGLVTALSCVRDAVNGELGDVAAAIGSLNQSYAYRGMHGCVSTQCGVHAWTAGSSFTDLQDESRATLEGGDAVQPAPAVHPAPQPAPQPCPAPVIEAAPAMIPQPLSAFAPPACHPSVMTGPVLSSGCPCETAPAVGHCCETTAAVVAPASPVCAPQPCCPSPAVQPTFGRQLVW